MIGFEDTRPYRKGIVTIFSIAAACLALVLSHDFLSRHAPLSDDLSMIAYSRHMTLDWLTKGLADYFIVYPEFYAPQSNFIRPVSNFAYWVFSTTLAQFDLHLINAIQLVVLNFGVLAAIATILFTQVKRLSGSFYIGLLAGIAALSIPTFWTTPTRTYTSFVFDELATLFCLLAFLALKRNAMVLATTALIFAIFTKEIALPVYMAFGLYMMFSRQFKPLLYLLFGLGLWIGLRLSAFGLHSEGLYVFATQDQGLGSWLIAKIQNVMTLPLGPVFYDEIGAWTPHNFVSRSLILICLNMALYGLIVGLLIATLRRLDFTDVRSIRIVATSPQFLTGLCAFLSFGFVAYIGANYRYAFIFLPFLLLTLAGAKPFPIAQRIFFIVFALGCSVASGPSLARFWQGYPMEAYRYPIIKDLFTTLHTEHRARSIIILNDVVLGYANPDALRILTPQKSDIVRGSSVYIDNCALDDLSKITTQVERKDDTIRITTSLPDCARFTFESSPRIGEFVSGRYISRNASISYELESDPRLEDPELKAYWLGKTMTTIVQRSANMLIVYFDFPTSRWIVTPSDSIQ